MNDGNGSEELTFGCDSGRTSGTTVMADKGKQEHFSQERQRESPEGCTVQEEPESHGLLSRMTILPAGPVKLLQERWGAVTDPGVAVSSQARARSSPAQAAGRVLV
jgi:hypothetical protein